ncbi:MAG: ATP-binding protein [Acidobacteria bacterium]|nr:ATP-binding protein [Acidobacteriota bacterium]
MASGEQLKALLKSHVDGDDERFFSVAMQVAAHEARRGHGRLAEELRALIDSARTGLGRRAPIPIGRPRGELANLLEVSHPSVRLGDMILGGDLGEQIRRVIREQRHAGRIVESGLTPRRKLLLTGPPGTGKTLTASVLAGELGFPLLEVRLDGLITKYMGETAAKLRQIFEATTRTRGVYFFDEFDAIGSQRGLPNDVGEIRRILNSFLQMIEQERSHSLVIAATNHPAILDSALFRRFDDILHYELPDRPQIVRLLKTRLSAAAGARVRWGSLAQLAAGLSYAEVTRAANEVLKDALIHSRDSVNEGDIRAMLKERQSVAEKLATRRRGAEA